jgi:hypothetical protein
MAWQRGARTPDRGAVVSAGRLAVALLAAAWLAGCAWLPLEEEAPAREVSQPETGERPALPPESRTTPVPEPERSARPLPLPTPAPEPLPPPSYHPAGEALVEQARREVLLGNDALAGSTLERALRIDGNNPWIWIELGHLRLAAGQRAAAESMARKAISLSTRDPGARGAAASLLQQAGGGG